MEPTTPLRDIRSLTQNEIRALVEELGQPAFRAKQLIEWLGEKQAASFDEMTNLPKALRAQLAERFSFNTPVEVTKQVSRDGSRKYLLQFNIRLIDFKLEFGRLADGTIVLADEISPDTCRFWDATTGAHLDKDLFRRDLGGEEEAYQEVMKRLLG